MPLPDHVLTINPGDGRGQSCPNVAEPELTFVSGSGSAQKKGNKKLNKYWLQIFASVSQSGIFNKFRVNKITGTWGVGTSFDLNNTFKYISKANDTPGAGYTPGARAGHRPQLCSIALFTNYNTAKTQNREDKKHWKKFPW